MDQFYALVITLLCELPLMAWLARPLPVLKVLIVASFASCLTHPVAWHVASLLSPAEYPLGIWLIESCVVVTEAVVYGYWLRNGMFKSVSWSLLANTVSFSLSWVLF